MIFPYQSNSGYFERAFGDIDRIGLEMLEAVKDVEFDTMIGTGLSGTLVVPTLARAFGTHWAIIRKEVSVHTSNLIEGTVGGKWLFVDDFISSGRTLKRVKAIIGDKLPNRTEYVGTYMYERDVYRGPEWTYI